MNWNELTDLNQLDQLVEESSSKAILIFKYSTTCSISRTVLNRLERNWRNEVDIKTYFLDLLAYRSISNAIAERCDVAHESPQVLIIENGKAVYDRSHFDINYQDIRSRLQMMAG